MMATKEDDRYFVDRKGNVFSTVRGTLQRLRPFNHSHGYLQIRPQGRGNVYVHRLVAEVFVPNPENKPEVNHKDGDKRNNAAENLEWVTRSGNNTHAYRTGLKTSPRKLSQDQVREIRALREQGFTLERLANLYGVGPTAIRRLLRGGTYRDV